MDPAKEYCLDYVFAHPESAALPSQLFKAELKSIQSRRRNYHIQAVEINQHDIKPNVRMNLVGLSFSGGGIRSSTFNLGVLQSLDQAGILSHIDYLSTVSGGGYIGSCLSSYWAGKNEEPFSHIEIDGVPKDCHLSGGQNLGNGRWRLEEEQLGKLALNFPASSSDRRFKNVIEAFRVVETDTFGDESQRIQVSLCTAEALKNYGELTVSAVTKNDGKGLNIRGKAPATGLSVPLFLGTHHDFPFRHKSGQLESQSFQHLRECACYLKPSSPFAGLRLPGLFLRGLIINAFIVLPFLLFLAVATVLIVGDDIHDAFNTTTREYLVGREELQQLRQEEDLFPGDYQNIMINLQPYFSWPAHEQKIDVLISGLPDGATIVPMDTKGRPPTSQKQVDRGTLLIQGNSPQQLDFTLVHTQIEDFCLRITAWESENHFKWMNSNWTIHLRQFLPKAFDTWQTNIWVEREKAKAMNEAEKGDEKRYVYALQLAEHIGWKKFIVVSGVPDNSFSIEGEFLGEGKWLFMDKAAADLSLSLFIPELQEDFKTTLSAWNSLHRYHLNTRIHQPRHFADIVLGKDNVKVQNKATDEDIFDQIRTISGHDFQGPEATEKILAALGLQKENGNEEIFFRASNLTNFPLTKEDHVTVKLLSKKNNEWFFTDKGRESLISHLQHQQILATNSETTVHVTAWRSGGNVSLHDPITNLYQNTFNYTKWILLIFALLLAFYPILQSILQLSGLKQWRLRDLLTRYICGASIAVVVICAFIEFQPLAILLFFRVKESFTLTAIVGGADKGLAILGSLFALSGGLFAANSVSKGAKLSAKVSVYAMGIVGPAVLWVFYLNFCLWALANENVPQMFENVEGFVLWVYLGVGLAIYFLSRQLYNINKTSIHPFYRDRLSKTFLISEEKNSGELIHNDGQKLHQLNTHYAPYHIINASLNITGSSSLNLNGRKADFFSFTREYVGSRVTGYVRTEKFEEMDKDMDLGTAMAISGAAAAPNMGRETKRSMTFILALLNIRLGYWAKNPMFFHLKKRKNSWRTIVAQLCTKKVGPLFLLKEMMGLVNEKSRFVNLSDGGHLENTGLYELVRRRCKYIIVCDSEADKNMTFHGLADAIRMVLIDMGIKIHIDLRSIYRKVHRGKNPVKIVGDNHFAVGVIEYGPGEEELGYLLYIKSSVNGKHSPYIEDYMARHADFPHETTADQFFNEAQFEAYRSLGWEVGEETMGAIASFPDPHPQEGGVEEGKRRLIMQAGYQWRRLLQSAQNRLCN